MARGLQGLPKPLRRQPGQNPRLPGAAGHRADSGQVLGLLNQRQKQAGPEQQASESTVVG